jgi:transposase
LAGYSGLFQADAYGGYGKLYNADRNAGLILEAACWVHARRPFFVMADLAENARRKVQGKKPVVISPLALEAVSASTLCSRSSVPSTAKRLNGGGPSVRN